MNRISIKSLLILSVASLCLGKPRSASAQANGVLREVYTGIGGTAVSDLTNNPSFPDNPTTVEVTTDFFEAPTDVDENYGQRLSAYIVAPATGSYTFWIASDDNSTLFLSTDDTPASKQVIASVPGWTSSREWGKYVEQQSAPVGLTAGQRYYIEALMKEGNGGDNLAVRWQLPGGVIEEPIPGGRLQVYGLGPPQISQQPTNVTVVEGGSATFSIRLSRSFGATYQWQRGGLNISGATNSSYTLTPVILDDNNSQFRCVATNPYGTTNSNTATLTVLADATPPTISSVVNLGDNTIVTVLFSEPVEAASGTNRFNYSINNGISAPSSAKFGADAQTVVLTTSSLNYGTTYTLTVNNVRDRASTPNTIAPNSQKTFTLDYTPLDASYIIGVSEPIGPSSRRTGLVISEIMYHPTNRVDGKNLEFLELYNSQVFAEDISGYRLSGEIDYTFPANTTIPAGGYLVVAPSPADVQSVYGISGVLGGLTNKLANGSGTIRLRNKTGAVLLEASYSGDPPWPAAADGAGHSLVLARPTYGEANPEAWAASDAVGGTPGSAETSTANPYRTIVINEFLAHTDDPEVDYVELYNYSTQSVSVAGCVLTDDPTTNRFVIPPGTTIAPRGFLVYNQTNMGFALSAAGETIYFKNPAGTKVIDAVRFKGQQNGVATGRYPDGAPGFYRLVNKTPGGSNGKILVSGVVINEVMFNPISGDSDDEFVELFNRGPTAVNLGGWRLSDGISFTFPTNAVIPSGGHLVAANNAAHLMTNYAALNINNTFGDYGGTLSNGGERIALSMPDEVSSTNNGVVVTNTIHIVVDEVSYKDGGRWGKWADGGGSSLELTDPRSDHRQAPNWADSDESSKSAWTNIEYTGTLDNGNGSADSFQVFLQGAGECLVDNVEVIPQGGGNLVANSDFQAGLGGWFPQGTHDMSYWQSSGGYGNNGACLHIVASSRGDTGANRVRTALTSTLSPGTVVTLRAKVRWLKGNPEILLRLHGNWLEAYGNILTAQNLGTPGAANSRLLSNAGPAIHGVTHSPLIPAAGQAVTVRAQVHDPDALASLVLKYRIDPGTNFNSVSMVYNGAGAYTATIPGQSSGALAAFYIQAADNAAPTAVTTFPDDAPVRECLVRFGETIPNTGRVGTYRFWITQATNNRWTSRERNSNEPLDATFVYGNIRVVYNIGTLYSGSPWHTPGYNGPLNNICDYVLIFPGDDRMLGATDFVMASLGNLNNDATAQREQAAFWMLDQLGVPTLYRRHVNLFVNGQKRGLLYEDAQQPSGDVVDEWFPNDNNGDLHKIEDWFEFDNSGDSKLFNVDATLQNFTTTGGAKKLARYRWNWRKRAVNDSANNYTNLFALVDAVNSSQPEPYNSQVQALMDYEEWARVFAVEHIVGNWDSYGYNRGKNMYGYKPESGKWNLLAWDIDFNFDNGGDPNTTDINPLSMPINDPTIRTLLSFPPFQRAFWRALEDAVNGPMVSANISGIMNAKYNGLAAAGIAVSSPSSTLSWIASRRSFIQSELATVAKSFAITSNGGNNFSTNSNYITLSGTAPIGVKTIEINGVSYPLTWTSVSNWTLNYALGPGVNGLTVQGYDLRGNPVAGSSDTITITYTGVAEQPQDFLVINEIMYNPAVPDASFIEIYNKSTLTTFDVSNFRIDGADFAFSGGTIVRPGGFLVVANDPAAFAAAYGASVPIAGVFNGKLKNGGETLKLVEPGATPAQDLIVDQVSYDSASPWPTVANGFGPSLQLVDPNQDNNRVANWAAITGGGGGSQTLINITDAWKYNQNGTDLGTTWRNTAYNDGAWPSGTALLYVEASPLPGPANTPLTLGATTYYFRKSFNFSGNPATTTLQISTVIDDGAVFYLNGVEVLRLGMPTGSISYSTFASRVVDNAVYEGPFTISSASLVQGNNVLAVEVHQVNSTSSDIVFGLTLDASSNAGSPYTPGAVNSTRATLPAIPPVWLNEVQPNNVAGAADRFGEHDPWVELYNSGASPIDLTGYYLSDNYTNLLRWPFPAGTTLNAGQFLVVWLDGQPAQTGAGELHSNFRIPASTGSVVLTTTSPSQMVVDYLNYKLVNNDRSYGAFPDGTPAKRQSFYFATPGAANSVAYPAFPVTINEWMAANSGALVDPADGHFDDWFELYNSGATPVDLTGFSLSDTLTNNSDFIIPAGYTVPAGGYLLVWADSDTGQNTTNNPDLHVSFKLSQSGEFISLFAPNGTNIDSVTFGPQTNDVSQGRYPDGNSGSFYYMATPTPRAANTIGAASSNAPPILAAIGNKTINEGAQLAFTAAATDPDSGQTLVYSLDNGAPPGAAINAGSGVFTWTPTEAQGPGVYSVTIRVTDNGSPPLSDFETITVTVNEVNSPPTLAPIGNKTVNEGSTLSFTAFGSDADLPSQTLAYSLDVGAPSGASIDPVSGAFSWTPTEVQGPGSYPVTVIVSDNGTPGLNASETITITVNEVNAAPVLAAIGNKLVNEGATLTFAVSAADPDLPAQTLAYSMDPGAPSGASFNAATRTFTWTPSEAQGPGTNSVTLRVSDNGSPALSDFETITIVVNEVNTAPVMNPIGNKSVAEGTLLTFTAVASDADVPTNSLTFSLDPGAPVGAAINPTTGVFSWTPTEAQGPSTNSITVRVTDNGSPQLSDAKTFAATVDEVNTAPVLSAINNRTGTVGTQLVITNTASDGDIPTNTLTFSLDPGAPAGAAIDSTTGVFTWTPATNQAPSTNMLTVRVTDNGTPPLSDAKTFSLVVNTVAELRITSVAVSADVVSLNWVSQAAKTYRVEYKDDLNQTNWSALGDFNATGSTTSATNSVNGASRRYYRIQQL